jgi:hypothetical protein
MEIPAPALDGIVERGVLPFFPTALTEDGSLPEFGDVLGRFDGANSVMLECRLCKVGGPIDVSLGFAPGRLNFGAVGNRHLQWQALRDFSKAWARGTPPLDAIDIVYLEQDFDAEGAGMPPAVFFNFVGQGAMTTPTASHIRDRHVALVRRLSGQFGWRLTPATFRTLERFVELAPDRSELPYFGIMTSRADHPLRLSVRLSPDQMTSLEFLSRLDWREPEGRLAWILEEMAKIPGLRPPVLAVDVIDEIRPRIGLEYITGECGRRNIARFTAAIGRLTELGLCTDAKGAALYDWLSFGSGPLASFLGRSTSMVRSVSHVKIVVEPAGVSAKAYLECSH